MVGTGGPVKVYNHLGGDQEREWQNKYQDTPELSGVFHVRAGARAAAQYVITVIKSATRGKVTIF